MNDTTERVIEDIHDLKRYSGNNLAERLDIIDDTTKQLMTQALDPYKHFGMKSIPHHEAAEPDYSWDDIISVLSAGTHSSTMTLLDMKLDNDALFIINMVLSKNMRLGVGEKVFLKTFPGSFETFSVMLASSDNEKTWSNFEEGERVLVQEKLDGVRAVIIVPTNNVKDIQVLSRSGKPILNVSPAVLRELSRYQGMVFDGEVLFEQNFDLTNGLTRDENTDKVLDFYAFDLIPIEFFHKGSGYKDTQAMRTAALWQLGFKHVKLVFTYDIPFSKDKVDKIFDACVDKGLEGVIVKKSDGLYENKRSKSWAKRKFEDTVDVLVTDYVEGKGKFKGTLGNVLVKHNGAVASVGGGFSDLLRGVLWRHKPEGLVIEIKHNGMTKNGVFRHPRFVKVRGDKMENTI